MRSIASSADLRRLFATSILARLPLEMLSIGLLVHAQHLTGSFAAAGVVTGVYAIALGVGGPLLGQLVDRRGQTSVLLASATVAAALLVAIAVQPVGAPLAVLLALAAGIGLATPRRSAPACGPNFQPSYPIPAPSAPPTPSRRPSSS
jgi:MFS family permease